MKVYLMEIEREFIDPYGNPLRMWHVAGVYDDVQKSFDAGERIKSHYKDSGMLKQILVTIKELNNDDFS